MKKLIYLIPVLAFLCLTACMTELQESQIEINDALLKELGESGAYIAMVDAAQKAHEVYGTVDRDRYTQIMEAAGLGICDFRDKGIPKEFYQLEGAVRHAELMMVFCEARDQVTAIYPGFWDLDPDIQVRAMEYRNQAIGFEPASVLAKY